MESMSSGLKLLSPTYNNEDPFSSSLKPKGRICEKSFRPTWSFPEITNPRNFQEMFEQLSDFDLIQYFWKAMIIWLFTVFMIMYININRFEEKYLGDKDPSEDRMMLHFTLDQPSNADNWDYK